MRGHPVWKRILLFLLSLTFVVSSSISGFNVEQSVASEFSPAHFGGNPSRVSTDLFTFPRYNNLYPGVTDGDAFTIKWGENGGFPYGVAIYLVILGEAGGNTSSGRDNDYVPRPDERVASDRRPQGTISFPNKTASDRLAAASEQGETKKKLTVGVYVLPIRSDSTVCTKVDCDPKQFATVLAQGGGELFISIPGEGRNPIATTVVKALFGTDLGKFLTSIIGAEDAETCFGYKADGSTPDSVNPVFRGFSCTSVIPVGAIFKVPGRVLKVGKVAIEDGSKIQRLIEVTRDVARLSGKFRTAEEVAKKAVTIAKPATLKWLNESEKGAKVYFGYDKVYGNITYVGITKDFAQRKIQHARDLRNFNPSELANLPSDLTIHQARAIEQFYINQKGLQKLDGELENKINSIAQTREIYDGSQQFAKWFIANFDLPQL